MLHKLHLILVFAALIAPMLVLDANAGIQIYQGQVYTDLPGFNGPTIQSAPPVPESSSYDNYFKQGF